jgi:hypothetical protein
MDESENQKNQISEFLAAWNNGEEAALDQLMPVVELELRRIAHNYTRRERGNHTLQTSALINEALLGDNLVSYRKTESDPFSLDVKNRSKIFGKICRSIPLPVSVTSTIEESSFSIGRK